VLPTEIDALQIGLFWLIGIDVDGVDTGLERCPGQAVVEPGERDSDDDQINRFKRRQHVLAVKGVDGFAPDARVLCLSCQLSGRGAGFFTAPTRNYRLGVRPVQKDPAVL
jgi:hypothetical protein